MKGYSRCHCARKHRNYRTWAKCRWKEAAWVVGEGEFALLAWCRTLTVSLWGTEQRAGAEKDVIDVLACGGACIRQHEIVRITMA